jgi:hypothetical protein
MNLKRKYMEGSDYMDGIATTTLKQNRLVEMRGPTGKQSRKIETVLPTLNDKNSNLVSMSFAGPVTGDGLYPKDDQEESILIIHMILIF